MILLKKLFIALALAGFFACDGSTTSPKDSGFDSTVTVCTPGSLGCPCMGVACDYGLICAGSECVLP